MDLLDGLILVGNSTLFDMHATLSSCYPHIFHFVYKVMLFVGLFGLVV